MRFQVEQSVSPYLLELEMISPATTKRRHPAFRADDTNIIFFVGTSFLDQFNSVARLNPNALVCVLDVRHELNKLVVSPELESRLVRLPLGGEKTIQQLVNEHGTSAQREALERLPAIASNDGLAQLACSGTAAVQELLSQPNVQQWLDSVVPELIRRAGGAVPQGRVAAYVGSAGGVSSQGAKAAIDSLVRIFVKSGVSSVDVTIHLIGGISYSGKEFQRTQQNTACSLVTWVDHFQSARIPGVTYSMQASEVFPVSIDRQKRSELVADQVTALTPPTVQDRIRQERSNRAADGQIGNALLLGTEHYRRVSEEQLRNDVAEAYLPELEQLAQTEPARSQVGDLRFDYVDSRQVDPPADELVDQLLETDEPEVILDLVAPVPTFDSVDTVAELTDGTSLLLSRLHDQFAAMPPTPREFAERLALLLALQERVVSKLEVLLDEQAELQRSVEAAAEKLIKVHKKIVSPPLVPMKSLERRIDDLCQVIEEYRERFRAWQDVSMEVELLETVSEDCTQLIEQDFHRLSLVLQFLKRQIAYRKMISRSAMVAAKPLDSTFFGLVNASFETDDIDRSLAGYLKTCVAWVTRHGLMHIVRSEDESIDSIVGAVRAGNAEIISPEWGGREARYRAASILVYPAVSPKDRNALTAVHQQVDANVTIAFADEDAPSRNLVHLKLCYCREIGDLITPYYVAGLRKVLADPATELFLPDVSVLTNLGIDIDSNSNDLS